MPLNKYMIPLDNLWLTLGIFGKCYANGTYFKLIVIHQICGKEIA